MLIYLFFAYKNRKNAVFHALNGMSQRGSFNFLPSVTGEPLEFAYVIILRTVSVKTA